MPYDFLEGDVLIRNIPDSIEIGSKKFYNAINSIKNKNKIATSIPDSEIDQGVDNTSNQQQPKQEKSLLESIGPAVRGLAPAAAGAIGGGLLGAATGGVPGAIIGASRGVAGTELANMLGGPIVGSVNAAFGTNFSTPSDAFEHLLNSIGIPESKTLSDKILEGLASAASGTLGVNKIGKEISDLGSKKQSELLSNLGREIQKNPAEDFAVSSGASLASDLAGDSGADTLGQVAAGLAGGIAGGKAIKSGKNLISGATAPSIPLSEEENIISLGKKYNVPVQTSDVLPPKTPIGQSLQQLGERSLLGTSKNRNIQENSRKKAVYDLLGKEGIDSNTTESVSGFSNLAAEDLLDNRKKILEKNAKQKNNIIASLSKSVEDEEKKIKKSLVDYPLDSNSIDYYFYPNTKKIVPNSIMDFKNSNRSEMKLYAKKLEENYKDFLENPTVKSLNDFRSRMGTAFNDPKYDPIRKEIKQNQKDIYREIRNDIYNIAKKHDEMKNTNFAKSLSKVDKQITDFNKDLKKSKLQNAIYSGEDTPENLGAFIFSNKPSDLYVFKKNLTKDGIQNAKSAVLKKILDSSGGYDDLSVPRFSGNIERYSPQINAFFNKEEKDYIDGLNVLLKSTERASKTSVANPTGVQAATWLYPLVFQGIFGKIGLGGSIVSGPAARIYESKIVRDLLVKISKSKNNAKAKDSYVNKLKNILLSTRNAQTSEGDTLNDTDN